MYLFDYYLIYFIFYDGNSDQFSNRGEIGFLILNLSVYEKANFYFQYISGPV